MITRSESDESGGGGGEIGARRVYMIHLREFSPVLTYDGDYKDYRSTADLFSPAQRRTNRSPLRSIHVRRYESHLLSSHQKILSSHGIQVSRKVYSYTFSVNGMAVSLTPSESQALAIDSRVFRLYQSREFRLSTTHTPKFLNLSETLWKAAAAETTSKGSSSSRDDTPPASADVRSAGENVIIGVIDTGVWPENFAFSDKVTPQYGPIPSRWRGSCVRSKDFSSTACNRKLIGATFFFDGFEADKFYVDTRYNYASPRDNDGHGTHTASTACGNHNNSVWRNSYFFGIASGIAPRARLSVYKVFWKDTANAEPSAMESDVQAAIDTAVKDGVDVISLSLGSSGSAKDFLTLEDVSLLNAANAGVVAAFAAGNDGPSAYSVDHVSPWYITVAASSHDRFFSTKVALGNGSVVTGRASHGDSGASPLPLIKSSSAAVKPAKPTQARLCMAGSLSPALAKGKIVLCDRGVSYLVDKSAEVKRAGGKGIIIRNMRGSALTSFTDVFHALPSSHVNVDGGEIIAQYIDSANGHATARISLTKDVFNNRAPQVCDFSSRGPSVPFDYDPNIANVLKPDIAAPGEGVWAAVAPFSTAASSPSSSSTLTLSAALSISSAFDIYDGTSMATPHISGIAALLKQKRPLWSPSAIKSALQTTARITDNRRKAIAQAESGKPAGPFDFGAGQANPNAVLDPGLVFATAFQDYLAMLNGYNEFFQSTYPQASGIAPIPSYDLNAAYICIASVPSGNITSIARTVTNVASAASTYKVASLQSPANVKLSLSPTSFTIAPGQSVSFFVSITSVVAFSDDFSFGSLAWTDGTHTVRSVIAVRTGLQGSGRK